MERFKLIKEVGDGTFGSVWRAINKQSGEVVAIKKIKKKYYSWEECVNLREVKSLQKMNHPNIVKLKEVILENDILYFVFEHMECNIYQLMKDREKLFPESEVRNWCFQVFLGLANMHQHGYFHRDLKPDMWAMGAIMAELFTLRPLFPGTSEADEICKICNVIGSPTEDSWSDGLRLARAINYQFPQFVGLDLSFFIPSASKDALNLIMSLCSWDPCKRPAAAEALQHPFFKSCYYTPPSLRLRATTIRTPPIGATGMLEQQFTRKYPGALNHLSSPKINPSLSAGVHRKLDIANKDDGKNDKPLKGSTKQTRHQPPGRKNTQAIVKGRSLCEVTDTAYKFSGMTIDSGGRQYAGQARPPAPRGGVQWSGESGDMFLRPTQRLQTGRGNSRKVAG